jgi:DnaJ-class molecular chaperone
VNKHTPPECDYCEGSGRVDKNGNSVRLDDPRALRCPECEGSGKRNEEAKP